MWHASLRPVHTLHETRDSSISLPPRRTLALLGFDPALGAAPDTRFGTADRFVPPIGHRRVCVSKRGLGSEKPCRHGGEWRLASGKFGRGVAGAERANLLPRARSGAVQGLPPAPRSRLLVRRSFGKGWLLACCLALGKWKRSGSYSECLYVSKGSVRVLLSLRLGKYQVRPNTCIMYGRPAKLSTQPTQR